MRKPCGRSRRCARSRGRTIGERSKRATRLNVSIAWPPLTTATATATATATTAGTRPRPGQDRQMAEVSGIARYASRGCAIRNVRGAGAGRPARGALPRLWCHPGCRAQRTLRWPAIGDQVPRRSRTTCTQMLEFFGGDGGNLVAEWQSGDRIRQNMAHIRRCEHVVAQQEAVVLALEAQVPILRLSTSS